MDTVVKLLACVFVSFWLQFGAGIEVLLILDTRERSDEAVLQSLCILNLFSVCASEPSSPKLAWDR